jgi:ATP-dependent RNA helicase DDX56/DBP9
VFVNDVDRCYKLKLFLEKFSIRSCVLNSELPLNSRYHIVEEFNSGVYNVVIATDEANLKGEGDELEEGVEKEEEKEESGKKRKRVVVKDKEYGAARGVDFKDVAAVVNFDFPASARAYAHRIGRTARAGNAGMSLSFVVPTDADSKEDLAFKTQKKKRGEQEDDETVLSRVETQQKALGRDLKPYAFDMKQIEGFRYRMEDALDSISRVVIKQARLKELKAEIINSDKLKTHFEDRPKDLAFLRHDKTVFPTQVLSHLKNVPKYLMPRVVAPSSATQEEPSKTFVPFHKHKPGKKGVKKRRNDPLKSFKRSKHT